MTSEPTDLDAVWRDATRDSMDANDNQERLRAALSALLDEVRRLRGDYDALHELYGTVLEQRDAARAETAEQIAVAIEADDYFAMIPRAADEAARIARQHAEEVGSDE